MLLGDDAGNTALWDLAAKTTFSLPIRPGRKPISAVAFNQSSSLCASGDIDGEVTVWDVHSRQVIWKSHLDYRVIFLGFLGGGSRLLTGIWIGRAPKRGRGPGCGCGTCFTTAVRNCLLSRRIFGAKVHRTWSSRQWATGSSQFA